MLFPQARTFSTPTENVRSDAHYVGRPGLRLGLRCLLRPSARPSLPPPSPAVGIYVEICYNKNTTSVGRGGRKPFAPPFPAGLKTHTAAPVRGSGKRRI